MRMLGNFHSPSPKGSAAAEADVAVVAACQLDRSGADAGTGEERTGSSSGQCHNHTEAGAGAECVACLVFGIATFGGWRNGSAGCAMVGTLTDGAEDDSRDLHCVQRRDAESKEKRL